MTARPIAPFVAAVAFASACAPAEQPIPDAGEEDTATASFNVSGAINAAGTDAAPTLAAVDQVLETFTRRRLTVTLAHATGGTVTLVLTDSDGPPSDGSYAPFGTQQAITSSNWKVGAVEYVNVGVAAEDASTASISAIEWSAGGRVAGTFTLQLVDPADDARKVTVTGSFDAPLSSGP